PDDIELELIESTAEPDAGGDEGARDGDTLSFTFNGELWYWRGPSPFHFITVPPDAAAAIKAVSAEVTYGWGMIPARVRIGGSAWETALWPKDGGYIVPVKDVFRMAEGLTLGDTVEVQLVVRH
ncbi:MAG TPA: DUF1905 domain-containing protein, partial [Candidatus Limnocylindrales bacterium]|nr:DUF1905 domain-containing protein [Candidatus Limnocylindrales bacterium]